MAQGTEFAMFGAGCFWQIEVEFRNVEGVTDALAGYSGGTLDNPSYEDVCSGKTGHTEVVRVEFDPQQVSYDALLEKFWEIHDPTQMNRQGPDVGSQYRSAIYHFSESQREGAEASKQRAQARFSKPIATEITSAATFWPAEDYHQRYLEKRGLASCRS